MSEAVVVTLLWKEDLHDRGVPNGMAYKVKFCLSAAAIIMKE